MNKIDKQFQSQTTKASQKTAEERLASVMAAFDSVRRVRSTESSEDLVRQMRDGRETALFDRVRAQ